MSDVNQVPWEQTAPLAFAADWPAPRRVRTWVSLRSGGVSTGGYGSLNLATHVGDDSASVEENRRRFAFRLALPGEPKWLDQVHGTRVLDLDADTDVDSDSDSDSDLDSVLTADGAVTGRPGVVCAVLTADCIPVVLADRHGRRVGVAHAGWRGLVDGVLPAAVNALGVPADDVLAWLGPGIGPQAFEVGDEVKEAFGAAGFDTEVTFVRNDRGRWLADLYALARQSLGGAGVSTLFGGDLCTFSDPERFFSHRRQAPCGRMATLVWMDE